MSLHLANKQPKKNLRIVVSGGGTGGHMIPGIALLQEFQRLFEGVEVLFLTPGTPLEKAILEEHEVPYHCVGVMKATRGGPLGKMQTALKLARATKSARKLLKDFQADYIFGVGG
ncbi:MAG: glycosyltransferase, partial [Planctomycetes bacterium]|nr:glycosyltransferase [Planctomycetota bacterium]